MGKNSDVTIRLSAEGQEQLISALRSIGPEGEKMARRIERAGTDASRGLLAINAAANEVKGAARSFAGNLGPVGSVLASIGPAGLGAAAGLGAVAFGLSKAFSKAREGMEFADSINTASRTLGIGVEALQEYRGALLVVGDASASFDAMLSSLLAKMGEFDRTGGGGKAAGAFKALGLSVRDANGQMKTGEQMLTEIIGKVSALGSEAQKADISKKLFGDQAQNFLALIQNGADGVDRLRAQMRSLGVVMDAEVVRRYAEAAEKSKLLAQAINVRLMSAFVDFAPILNDAAELWAKFAKAVGWARDNIVDLENKSTARLEASLNVWRARRDYLRGFISDLNPKSVKDVVGATLKNGGQDPWVEKAELDANIARAEKELELRRKAGEIAGRTQGEGGGILPSGISDAAQRDMEVLQRLQRQLETFGDARQQAIDNALSGLSKEASPELRQRVADIAGRVHDMSEAQRELNRELEEETRIRNEGKQVLESVMTDQERYEAQSARLKDLLASGAITQETYNRALQKAREQYDPATKAVKQMADGVADASVELMSSVASFHDAGEAAKDFAQKMLQLILQIVAWQPIQSAMSGWLGGMFLGGSGSGSVFHDGGMAGDSAPSRSVPSVLFAAAPRFHTGGLLPGEVPVIARRGEGIFTPRQMDNADALLRGLAAAAVRPGNVTVNVHKGAERDDAQVTRGPGGDVTVDVMVARAEAKIAGRVGIGQSPINTALEGRYGLNPAARLQRR